MFSKISRLFLYASLFAPLVVARDSFFPFIAEKAIIFRILIELALLFFLIHTLIEFGHSSERKNQLLAHLKTKLTHPMAVAAMIFAAVFLVTAILGINPSQSVWSNFERGDGAFALIHYVIFFLLTIVLCPSKKNIESLLYTNIGVSLLMCFYAIAQLVSRDAVNSGFILAASSRVSGTLGNPSYLAAYLLINLAVITYFFLQKKEAWWRVIFGMLFFFELYVLLNTGTRAAFLGLIVGMITLCVINLIISKNQIVRSWITVALVVAVGMPILFFSTHNAPVWLKVPVINRIINYESAVTDIQPRIWTWTSALQAAKDRPILGYGAENFPYPFDRYYNPGHYGIESFFDRTHNIFLEYLVSGGIILLLAWLAIFYFYYRGLMRRPKNFWWSILFVVPIMYFCQGFFLFDTLPIFIMLYLFLALFISQEHETNLPTHNEPLKVSPVRIAGAILLLGAFGASLYYTAYLPMRKNALLTEALKLQNTFTGELQGGAKELSVTPAQIIIAYQNALNFKSPVGQEETIGMFQKFTAYIIDVLARNPDVVKNPQYVSEVRELVGSNNRIFDANTDIFPGIKQAYINGGINLRVGVVFEQPDLVARGKKIYNDALATAPNRLELIRLLIEVARSENDTETFEALIKRAEALRPDVEWRNP